MVAEGDEWAIFAFADALRVLGLDELVAAALEESDDERYAAVVREFHGRATPETFATALRLCSEADPNRRRPEARSERPNALLGAALKPMRRFAGAVSARVQAIAQP